MHNYTETLRIFMTCASIVPLILQKFPLASFVINGAQSLDLESNKIEGRATIKGSDYTKTWLPNYLVKNVLNITNL